jgi:hypothetical protein
MTPGKYDLKAFAHLIEAAAFVAASQQYEYSCEQL